MTADLATLTPEEELELRLRLRKRQKEKLESAGEFPDFPEWLQVRYPQFVWDRPHQLQIYHELQLLREDKNDKLMIFMPPRHSKTQSVTIGHTGYILEKYPDTRVILAAYNADLAMQFSRSIRRVLDEQGVVSEERRAQHDWHTTSGGGLRAVGVGGGITGMGGNWIVIDDPVKGREEADSVAYRERVWEWYQDDLYTRRQPGAKMILIMTRWHLDDLAGRILSSDDGPNWRVLHLPAIAMEDDPLGRAVGEALWPEQYDAEFFSDIERDNPRGYWALYQGMPQPESGVIFEKSLWDQKNRFDIADERLASKAVARYQFWDTAREVGHNSAFTTCVTLDLMPDYTVLLRDVYRERLSFPELMPMLMAQARKHDRDGKLERVVIEYASSGVGLFQTLVATAPEWLESRIQRFSPKASKEDRARAVVAWCVNDMVMLPNPHEQCAWLFDFEKELYEFPQGKFLDQVDAFVMGLDFLRGFLSSGLFARNHATQTTQTKDWWV